VLALEQPMTKREKILQATLELIQEQGLNELTTAKIARRSATAETIIYRHFSSKQEILTELLQRVGSDFQKSAEAIFSEPISPPEKLAKMSASHLDFIQQTKGISRILFSEQIHLATPDDPMKIAARTIAADYRNCVKQIICEGKKSGHFDATLDVETASRSFMGLHYLLMHEWSLDSYSWDLKTLNDTIADYYIKVWKANPEQDKQTID
jgi:AcrR family transcriptional regulator